MGCSEEDFQYLRELVREQSANVIEPSRNALFETRLTPVAKMAGAGTVEELVSLLRDGASAHLQRSVAEAMTINETSFFRDVTPWETLRRDVLPRLVEANRITRTLRIWSAAASTGQEAYSLAMLLHEHFPELVTWDVKVIGTDLSRQVVEYARGGRYRRIEVNRGLPARLLVKYFRRDGEAWEIAEAVRRMCEFRCANLCEPLPPLPRFDLVLLRNVLLYFPRGERGQVFRAVHRQMAPGGYLLLGNAEQAEDSTDLFGVEFASDCYFYRPVAEERV